MLTRNALVTVTVNGVSLGTWITKSGGQLEADGQKTRLGGMSPEVALGGPASRENVTVARLNDAYMQGKLATLEAAVGTGTMSVTHNFLNNARQVTGSITYSGILNRCTVPEADDNAADPAMIELELLAHEAAVVG